MPTRIEFPEDYQFSDALSGIFGRQIIDSGVGYIVVASDVSMAKQMWTSHPGAYEDATDTTLIFLPCDAAPNPTT